MERFSSFSSKLIDPIRERFVESPEKKAEKAWLRHDPLLVLVKQTYEDSDSLWRTISGVSREIGIDFGFVEFATNQLSGHFDEIVCSSYPTPQGWNRYTTRDHFDKKAPWFIKLKGALAGGID